MQPLRAAAVQIQEIMTLVTSVAILLLVSEKIHVSSVLDGQLLCYSLSQRGSTKAETTL